MGVSLWTDSEREHRSDFEYCHGRPEVGTVMGPGGKPGTLLVKFNRNDSLVNFKPNQLRKMSSAELTKHSPDCICHECMWTNHVGEDSDTDDDANLKPIHLVFAIIFKDLNLEGLQVAVL